MTVWWSRRGVYEPPEVLTDLDLDWLRPHLRLAGLRDDDPPPMTSMAAMVGSHEFVKAMRGTTQVIRTTGLPDGYVPPSASLTPPATDMERFIAEHDNPGLVEGAPRRRRP